MRFVMSRVTEDDLDKLVKVQYKSFASLDVHNALFGPNTETARNSAKTLFLQAMREDPADCWLKIVDQDSGRIVSGSNWKIYPTSATIESSPIPVDWYPSGSVEKEAAEHVWDDFLGRRRKHMSSHAHVLLAFLFTDPEYQRHRCGSMMVKWGCELADRLFVPLWVEATAAGHHLYQSNGFEDAEKVDTKTKKWRHVYTVMLREAKLAGLTVEIPN